MNLKQEKIAVRILGVIASFMGGVLLALVTIGQQYKYIPFVIYAFFLSSYFYFRFSRIELEEDEEEDEP